MDTVAIFGVGLIGGSFALAIRSAGFDGPILGVSSAATIAQAVALGVVSEGVGMQEACARADLIYLAQPIRQILDCLPLLAPYLRPGQLVTDAGSTIVQIVETAAKCVRRAVFLGGHPMAGKEVRGVSAADVNLFRDRPYLLTPVDVTTLDDKVVDKFVRLLVKIGAKPVILSPGEHDRAIAYVSHLPQLLSTALAGTLTSVGRAGEIAGPAALDYTRLALSPFDIWQDILATNPNEIAAAVDQLVSRLLALKQQLTSPSMEQAFAEAAALARYLRKN